MRLAALSYVRDRRFVKMVNAKVIEACHSVLEFDTEIGGYIIKCSNGKDIEIIDLDDSYFFEHARIYIDESTNLGFGFEVRYKKFSKFHSFSSPGALIDNNEQVIDIIKKDIISILKEM